MFTGFPSSLKYGFLTAGAAALITIPNGFGILDDPARKWLYDSLEH